MRIYLVRHPRPEVPAGHCYGRSDLAANEADVERVHAALANQGLPGAMPVYASPLARSAVLAQRLSPAPAFDARLAEMDFGAWEMRSWDDIPRNEIDAWSADLLHYRPGGGESVMDVAARVAGFDADIRREGHAQAIIICHAGTMRLMHSLHLGGTLVDAALRAAQAPHRIDYGEVMMLET
ncbi:histidine phosphatase family protein [Massilia sp. CFBP9012]|uniref:histidine phosphatase family protein n=1 Tax=Massilia sp. CFBP9012 TaxID=3096531 RepID=UPI002A6B5B93|nr:histidine phosphatase family protein [Massilia sp. CFBP9012]MDY0978459.1 histidine phosphatase family protein [Massilia sp. CFBP9012]